MFSFLVTSSIQSSQATIEDELPDLYPRHRRARSPLAQRNSAESDDIEFVAQRRSARLERLQRRRRGRRREDQDNRSTDTEAENAHMPIVVENVPGWCHIEFHYFPF